MSRKNIIMKRHIKRALEILTHQGPKAFFNKVKLRLSERAAVAPAPAAEETIPFGELDKESLDFSGTLSVHLHLFYDDLAEEFAAALSNIPVPFDLYISVRKELTDERIAALQTLFKNALLNRQAPSGGLRPLQDSKAQVGPSAGAEEPIRVTIRRAENRGRDIAPMYVLFGKELSSYTYVLHLHSKKSLYTGTEQEDWRQYSVRSLIGSPAAASRLLKIMNNHPDTGLVCPKRFAGMAPEAYGWLSNEEKGRTFLESIGIPFQGGVFLYPAGSFFLVRNAAIGPVWKRNLTLSDFDEEAGQTDGTLAHVLERALGPVVSAAGFRSVILDYDDASAHLGQDRDTFAPVFRRDYAFLKTELMSYDVISFDVFDTLLTRKYLTPADVFRKIPAAALSERETQGGSADGGKDGQAKNGLFSADAFARLRMEAENEAIREQGASCTLDSIYGTLQKLTGCSDEDREALKAAEEVLEKDALLPRRNLCALYRELVKAGKTILLVSDMYLPGSFYEEVLKMHGLGGYSRLYLSCEEGLRKDDGGLWEKVLSDWKGKTFAHVGDNQQSDWQQLSDRAEKTLWVMSPSAEEAIAGVPELVALSRFSVSSLVRGLFRNGGLFNSPFALAKDGRPHFSDPYAFGYTVFGPLLYEYMVWLQENTPDGATIAFLAREGWLFQQVYELAAGDRAKKHLYLLTSRRAASVAAMRTEEDIREIVRRKYDGSLRNLLSSRLGAGPDVTSRIADRQIHIADPESGETDDYEKTLKEIAPLLPALLENAASERQAYTAYLNSVLPEEERDRTVLVDIGYAGTIQYYLSKLTGRPLTAAYLAVFTPHPGLLRLACPVQAMYEKGRESFAETIEKTQLFLESVLQAPYGQLLHFSPDGQPVYREEKEPSEGIRSLQEGILQYAKDRASAEELTETEIHERQDPAFSESAKAADSRAFMEALYTELLVRHDYLTKDTAALFTVEDRYSQDTCLHLNPDTRRWEI